MAPVFYKQVQQLLLRFAQFNFGISCVKAHGRKIKAEMIDLDRPTAADRHLLSQLGVHSCPQDGKGKGLGNVIVGAPFQPVYNVHIRVICRQKNDGNIRRTLFYFPQQL